MENLVLNLFKIKCVKFGNFKLKSGLVSPIYIDFREIIGYPSVMNDISELMFERMSRDIDEICGVPYTALPLATCISVNHSIPMLIRRKEVKDYGTKKMIEGVWEKNSRCCIIEDVISTGGSVIETATELRRVGLTVTEAIVLVDRGQGGRENLNNFGIDVKSVLGLHDILTILFSHNKIDVDQYNLCREFVEMSQIIIPVPKKMTEISLKERGEKSNNRLTKKIFNIIETKKTNLCVAADVETMEDLLSLAKQIGQFICILKIHADIINDFNAERMQQLKEMSQKENFLLMEDRKFADIGNTVKLQLKNKYFDYLSWCDLLTVHGIPGDGVLDGIKSAAREANVDIGCLIVAEMSSKGALTNTDYKDRCAEMALRHGDIVCGFVAQSLVKEELGGFIHCTPGVKLEKGGDQLGQNYRSVSELKNSGFIDIFIVGRGITEARNPREEAEIYQLATFYQ